MGNYIGLCNVMVKKKVMIAISCLIVMVILAILFPANGPPPDQISQVRQQIKSEQMIQ